MERDPNMKTANVVSARDVAPQAARPEESAETRMDRMESLLRRHPQISAEETEELFLFLTKGSQLEVGLVTGRDGLAPRLAAFRRLHAARFRPGAAAQLLFALAFIGPVLLLAWYVTR
jgi:hypothetical protein